MYFYAVYLKGTSSILFVIFYPKIVYIYIYIFAQNLIYMKNSKTTSSNFLKIGVLLLGISLLLWNCDKENIFNEIQNETVVSTEAPRIETFTLNQLNQDKGFNALKDNYRILQVKSYAKGYKRSSVRLIDTLGITIDANSIKKITGNSYVSYTMLMIEPNDTSNDFSNLVIQEREGKKQIFTVRYFQEQNKARSSSYAAKNSLSSFSGDFQMRSGITTTEMWGDPEGGGGGGGTSGGCEEYITICNTVNVWVPHGCGCGHMPGQSCEGCNGSYPYYTLETKQECKEHCKWDNYTNNTGGNNTGNNSGGGSGTTGGGSSGNNSNNNSNTNVATTPVNPDGTSAIPQILISQLNITNLNEIDWINNQTIENQNLLFNFIKDNNYSDDAKDFAFTAIGALMEIFHETTFEEMLEVLNLEQDYKSRMSASEIKIFENLNRRTQLLYLQSAYNAETMLNKLYPSTATNPCSVYNGQGDAFRHAFFNALSTIRIGEYLTEKLTTAHEDRPAPFGYTISNYNKENQMDLYNNSKGREIAVNGSGLLWKLIKSAKENGVLKYLSNLNSSNCRATNSSILIPTK